MASQSTPHSSDNQPSTDPVHLGSLDALSVPSPGGKVIGAKTMENVVVQKAIVCLYLRKRAARVVLNRNLDCATAAANYYEAHNALESIKRVLWHNNWS